MKITTLKTPTGTDVTLGGDLGEKAEAALKAAGPGLTTTPVRFFLNGLGRINSVGAGAWSRFIAGLKGPFELHQCTTDFMDYALIVKEVTGNGKIVSFFAPVQCSKCAHGSAELQIMANVEAGKSNLLPACPKCGANQIFAVEPGDFKSLAPRS